MAESRKMPKIIRGDGVPALPESFLVHHPDFRDLWEIASGLSQLQEEERNARVAEVIDAESLTSFVSTFGMHEIASFIHNENLTPLEAASSIAGTNLLMILIGLHFALQHHWEIPDFEVPDTIADA